MSGEEERVRLEAERDFLLASLDDLDVERAAGEIDEESHARLHADYTARAAAAIRALRDGVDTQPARPRVVWRRRVAIGIAVVVFAGGAGFGLAAALGARLPGETSSGNTATRPEPQSIGQRRRTLERALAVDPSDVPTRLLLAQLLEADGDLADALAHYDEVVRLDPTNAVAHAQAGRILYLSAQAVVASAPAEAADLVDASITRLDRAVDLDPQYADARFFRAIVRANEYGDFAGAQSDLQRYLLLAPQGTFVEQARDLLADVTNALEPTTPTTRK